MQYQTDFLTLRNHDEYNVNWKKNIVYLITKIQLLQATVKKQIERNPLHLCKEHYSE